MKKLLILIVFILAFSPIVFCITTAENNWTSYTTANFIIKKEKNSNGLSSPNLSMNLEKIYSTLRLNIGWMMNGKITVYIYSSYENYLKGEGENAYGSRALAYPLENTIAFYDNKENFTNTKQDIAHEIVHMFTTRYFNPDQDPNLDMPPRWIDEGMATLLEDSTSSTPENKVWDNLLLNNNIKSYKDEKKKDKKFTFSFNKKEEPEEDENIIYFTKFEDFFAENQNYSLNWYIQAYAIVRYLFNPYDSKIAKRKVQFEQFCELIKEGRDLEYALRKVYHYRNFNNLEQKFWKWYKKIQSQKDKEKKDYDFFLTI
ncbi:MAG: hypothetical protein HN833_02930 [Elusimicrobiaceae bacterium]|jgi:hypothetical protein|nr:hypothetical protein [Elusimicrobiaceae bacterium]MBT4008186.1 hypothetical protein [Elusimicrobiaceae bacterium]MBT4402514.1 hypothetical protein [Elusimicrobiaceae bacterium]MBT4439641.1 hypothetical protein [Elusimicrobiaceae bacterium]MBT5988065.1 hypothetical protein [Elusimicrobiaceae bacterium]